MEYEDIAFDVEEITKPDRQVKFCKWCRVPWSEYLDAYYGTEQKYQQCCATCQKLPDPSTATPWYKK